MTSSQAALQIKNALNKLDSNDYANIQLWKIQEALNVATQRFVRRRLPGKEKDSLVVEDIGILLKDTRLSGSNRDMYFLSHSLPVDYFGLSRVAAICAKDNCILRIASEWVEDANTNDYLQDWDSQPSFDFEQTFHTLSGRRIKSYHGGDFEVKELDISYYRQPQYIQMPNAPLPGGGIGKDMTWEWKDDVADLLIEEAVWILSGNTGDYNRNALAQQIIQR